MKKPPSKNIKRGAHTLGFLAALWTLFSLFAFFDWIDAHRHISSPGSSVALTIWAIHLFLIVSAILAWKLEQPRQVLWLETGEEINEADVASFEPIQGKKNLIRAIFVMVFGAIASLAEIWAWAGRPMYATHVGWRVLVQIVIIFTSLGIATAVTKFCQTYSQYKGKRE